jgi:hypothetical protein
VTERNYSKTGPLLVQYLSGFDLAGTLLKSVATERTLKLL